MGGSSGKTVSLPHEAFTDNVGSNCVAAIRLRDNLWGKIVALRQTSIHFVSQIGALGGKFVWFAAAQKTMSQMHRDSGFRVFVG